MDRRPNFFIVGAPKCGTTALSEYLSEHPQVFFSQPKEPTYFADDFDIYRFFKTRQDYDDLFARAKDIHTAIGEGTTWYMYSKVAIKKIIKYQPNARFIIMLRNPVDAAYALHSQLLNSLDETEKDFQSAWRMQTERKMGQKIPRTCREASFLLYGDVYRFADQVEMIFNSVSRERVHVIIFDDFILDVGKAYREVVKFLGIDDDGRQIFPIRNANRRMRSQYLAQLALRPSASRTFLVNRLKQIFKINQIGFSSLVERLNYMRMRRDCLEPEFRSELEDYFRPDIARVGSLLDRDLSHWLHSKRSIDDE